LIEERGTAELAKLPLLERLARRTVDGERNGIEADLDEAMTQKPPLCCSAPARCSCSPLR
jgi:5-methyltetrahydrofolate--homocysteine methyltransferase